MLHPDNAIEIITQNRRSVVTQILPITQAAGRVLPHSIGSPIESPPFPKSAMDGYALKKDDPSKSFKVLETIAAGDVPSRKVIEGTCSKIMTGAMMPEGADKVVRVEYTAEESSANTGGDSLIRIITKETSDNVILKGENIKVGDTVLEPKILKPQDIGILASSGIAEVEVSTPPIVGVITTGSELATPGSPLLPGQIYNSNGYQICSQISALSCPWHYYGIAPDTPEALNEMMGRAISECDFIILSGGVSMGEFDYVPQVIKENGAEIIFHKLAIKPGKPTLFARKDEKFIFGLPGNPVSTFVIFEILVKPALLKWMGLTWTAGIYTGTLSETIRRRDADRLEYRPVYFKEDKIVPLNYHGSAHLNALSEANALIRIEIGVKEIPEGTKLDVRLI